MCFKFVPTHQFFTLLFVWRKPAEARETSPPRRLLKKVIIYLGVCLYHLNCFKDYKFRSLSNTIRLFQMIASVHSPSQSGQVIHSLLKMDTHCPLHYYNFLIIIKKFISSKGNKLASMSQKIADTKIRATRE